MCLSRVDAKPQRKYGVGFKSVQKTGKETYICYDHTPHTGTIRYPLNRWIKDPNDGRADGRQYRTGFHLSLDLKSIRELNKLWNGSKVAIKLRFRKVTATGGDSLYGEQVVAREVCNLGEC